MVLFHDEALVLRRFPFSESSLVVHLLTREHGRVHLLARGVYRPRSRYFALLDLFDTLSLAWSQRPGGELGELREGEIHRRRRGPRTALDRYRAAVSVLELAELGSRPGESDRALFEGLELALDRLDDPRQDPGLARLAFELGFLDGHGLAPALERCAACGGPAPASASGGPESVPRAAFSAGAGGRLCASCAANARASARRVGTLPLDVLELGAKLLRATREKRPLPAAGRVARELVLRTRDFVERFLEVHLETRLQSHRHFLAAPNRNAP